MNFIALTTVDDELILINIDKIKTLVQFKNHVEVGFGEVVYVVKEDIEKILDEINAMR